MALARKAVSSKHWLVLGGLLLVLVLSSYWDFSTGGNGEQAPVRQGATSTSTVDDLTPLVSGIEAVHTNRKRRAPLEIRTDSGSNYYVKLVEVGTNETAMTMLIASGETLSIKAPLGQYKLRYATGRTWWGEPELFGPKTKYAEADKVLNFRREDGQVTGYTITLVLQRNGNMTTRAVSANQF